MSMRGFGIENWLKSTKVDTRNMSKKKLRKEAEDEAKAREEAEVGYDTKIEAEEITDEDLTRITQKMKKQKLMTMKKLMVKS